MPGSLKDLHIIFASSLYQVATSFMLIPLPGESLKDSGICVLFFASFLLTPQPGGCKRFRDLQLFLHHFWYHSGACVKALPWPCIHYFCIIPDTTPARHPLCLVLLPSLPRGGLKKKTKKNLRVTARIIIKIVEILGGQPPPPLGRSNLVEPGLHKWTELKRMPWTC